MVLHEILEIDIAYKDGKEQQQCPERAEAQVKCHTKNKSPT